MTDEDFTPIEDSPASFLAWPPPGLEQIQGMLLPVAGIIGLGGSILVLPLLFAIGSEQSFTSTGPFGSSWWVLAATSGLGLLLLLEGFNRLFLILRAGNLAVKGGHGWLTVAQVVADGSRDTGFLLQGARIFIGLEPPARERLLRHRLLGSGLYFAAGMWLVLGFVLAVLLATHGILGPAAVWIFTLLPVAICALAGLCFRVASTIRVRSLRRAHRDIEAEEMSVRIAAWTGQADKLSAPGVLGRGPAVRAISLRILSIVGIVGGIVVLFPLVMFSLMGTVAPAILMNTIPRFRGVQERANIVEHMREFRLTSDRAITPVEAGGALLNLNFVGRGGEPDELQNPPGTHYEQGWQFGRKRVRGVPKASLLMEMTRREISDEAWEILGREASNPAHREFAILARAPAADFATAWYQIPLSDRYNAASIPIPRFQGVSDGAKAHVAVAAYEMHRGRLDLAEMKIREVISTGFLMMDDHPELVGNLIGVVLVGIGRDALESFCRATGRTDEADRIREGYEHALEVTGYSSHFRGHYDFSTVIGEAADIVDDPEALRGLRWEMLTQVCTATPFVNLHGAVFGPGMQYEEWLERARQNLVRYPAEEELFRLAQYGFFISPRDLERPGLFARILGLVFGKSRTSGSFAVILGIR